MRLGILLLILVSPSATLAQSYSGYVLPDGSSSYPTISFAAHATLTCVAGVSADPVNYPPGCYVISNAGSFLVKVNGAPVTAPSAGVGTLYCQGQAYLACTLNVNNPNSPPPPHEPVPPPKPDPAAGGYYQDLGHPSPNPHKDACNPTGLSISLPQSLSAGQPTVVTITLNNLGGGFCSTTSGGHIDWGDNSPQTVLPTVQAPAGDPCAVPGTVRLGPGPYKLTHTYFMPGPFRITAWAQGDFKDNGDPGGASKGNTGSSGSWRCHQQRWMDISVTAPLAIQSSARWCQIKAVKKKCPVNP
jgi:hypothetical protein